MIANFKIKLAKLNKTIPLMVTEYNAEWTLESFQALFVPTEFNIPYARYDFKAPAFLAIYTGYFVGFAGVFGRSDFY